MAADKTSNHGNSLSHNVEAVTAGVTNLSAHILLEGSLGQNETIMRTGVVKVYIFNTETRGCGATNLRSPLCGS